MQREPSLIVDKVLKDSVLDMMPKSWETTHSVVTVKLDYRAMWIESILEGFRNWIVWYTDGSRNGCKTCFEIFTVFPRTLIAEGLGLIILCVKQVLLL